MCSATVRWGSVTLLGWSSAAISSSGRFTGNSCWPHFIASYIFLFLSVGRLLILSSFFGKEGSFHCFHYTPRGFSFHRQMVQISSEISLFCRGGRVLGAEKARPAWGRAFRSVLLSPVRPADAGRPSSCAAAPPRRPCRRPRPGRPPGSPYAPEWQRRAWRG